MEGGNSSSTQPNSTILETTATTTTTTTTTVTTATSEVVPTTPSTTVDGTSKGESDDTVIIIGVVVGSVAFIVVLLVVVLIVLRRRRRPPKQPPPALPHPQTLNMQPHRQENGSGALRPRLRSQNSSGGESTGDYEDPAKTAPRADIQLPEKKAVSIKNEYQNFDTSRQTSTEDMSDGVYVVPLDHRPSSSHPPNREAPPPSPPRDSTYIVMGTSAPTRTSLLGLDVAPTPPEELEREAAREDVYTVPGSLATPPPAPCGGKNPGYVNVPTSPATGGSGPVDYQNVSSARHYHNLPDPAPQPEPSAPPKLTLAPQPEPSAPPKLTLVPQSEAAAKLAAALAPRSTGRLPPELKIPPQPSPKPKKPSVHAAAISPVSSDPNDRTRSSGKRGKTPQVALKVTKPSPKPAPKPSPKPSPSLPEAPPRADTPRSAADSGDSEDSEGYENVEGVTDGRDYQNVPEKKTEPPRQSAQNTRNITSSNNNNNNTGSPLLAGGSVAAAAVTSELKQRLMKPMTK